MTPARRARLERNAKRDEMLDAIRLRLLEGKSYTQIADELKLISRNAVSGYVHAYRLRGMTERPAVFLHRWYDEEAPDAR